MSMVIQPARFAAVDLSGPVIAALSGTPGFALDPSDTSRMWTDVGRTVNVAAINDAIQIIDAKWGNGGIDAIQSTPNLRPLWSGTNAAEYDNINDYLEVRAASFLNNKPAVFFCGRLKSDALGAMQPIAGISSVSGTLPRFRLILTTTGRLDLQVRNLDAGVATVISTASSTIVGGEDCVVTAHCDYAGTRSTKVRKNGAEVGSATLTQPAGNTQATNSTAFWLGRNISALEYFNGKLGRMVFADKVMTGQQILDIEAWVGQGSLA